MPCRLSMPWIFIHWYVFILKTIHTTSNINFLAINDESCPTVNTAGQTFFFSLSSQLILHAIEENSVNGFISAASNAKGGKSLEPRYERKTEKK